LSDVTDWVRTEEDLRGCRERLERLVEERTAELRADNDRLRREIEGRRRTEKALRRLHKDLAARLAEAGEALRAIRGGEVDALLVTTAEGERVYTLAGSERPYRILIEAMGEGALTLSRDGTILYANRAFAGIVGMPLERILGAKVQEFLPAREGPEPAASFAKAVLKGHRQEAVLMAETGEEIPVLLSSTPLPESDPPQVCCVVTDLSAPKRTDAFLKESEERFRRLFDQSPLGTALVSPDFRFLRVNEAFCRITGYSAGEMASLDFPAITHPEDLAADVEQARRLLAGKIDQYEMEKRYIRKDGSIVWVRLHVRGIRDEGGRFLYFLPVVEDITERKEAEAALKAQETLLRSVLETLPVGVWVIDGGGRIVLGNEAGRRIWGGARYVGIEEFGDYKGWWAGTGMRIKPEEWGAARAIVGGETSLDEEIEIENFDGKRKIILHSAVPIRDDGGKVTGAIVVNQDISDRKRMEEALRRSHEELEERVRERTRELFDLTEDLREEVRQRRDAEEAARREQIFRETIEDSLVTGLVAVDHEGRILSVNDAFCAMTGWSREELLGTGPPYRFWPPEEIETIRATAWKTLGKGSPLADQEFVLLRRSGERFPVLVYASPFRDPEGTPKGYVVSVSDITERKKAETEYRTILKTAMDGFWISDHEGRFLDVNDAACRHFGYTREELLGGMRIPDIEAAESPEETAARIRKIREEGQDRFETRHRRKDGRIVDTEVSVNYLDIGGGRFFVFIRDITERKKAEEVVRESEERFRSLVEHSLVGFFLVQKGKVVFLNPEQENLFGTPPEDFPLESLGSRIHIEDLSRFTALLLAIHGGDGRVHETNFRFIPFGPADAEAGPGDSGFSGRAYRWVHCRTSPTLYRREKATLVNMVDITQFKEFERIALIQEKMASLGQVAAGIAHEIRNPLSGLNLYLSAGERMVAGADGVSGETLEDLRTAFSQMKSVSGKIERIVRRVMEFARPEPLRLEFIDVREAVHEAVQLSAATVRKRGVRLEEMSCGNLPRCRADVRLLEQVLLNLITNAVQAMERWAGEKRIEIGCAAEGGHIRITVADSGPGVPPHLRHRIFEPFFTTKKEGTGIGLSISHKIVSDHGGFLTVGTSKWGGALFTIGIPIGAVDFMADI
jgi:PAS domain S-box-containing protein